MMPTYFFKTIQGGGGYVQSSFPVLHKVGIFVQLLMRINWKWLLVNII